jgi:hypothetical protein
MMRGWDGTSLDWSAAPARDIIMRTRGSTLLSSETALRPGQSSHSPTNGSLEHDGVPIESDVENKNPDGHVDPTASETEERNEGCEYKRRTVAYLGALRHEFDTLQE